MTPLEKMEQLKREQEQRLAKAKADADAASLAVLDAAAMQETARVEMQAARVQINDACAKLKEMDEDFEVIKEAAALSAKYQILEPLSGGVPSPPSIQASPAASVPAHEAKATPAPGKITPSERLRKKLDRLEASIPVQAPTIMPPPKPIIALVEQPVNPLELVLAGPPPKKRVLRPQGSQPTRKVEHKDKTIMLFIPQADLIRAVIFHLLGCGYAGKITGVGQKYFRLPSMRALVQQARSPLLLSTKLAYAIKIPPPSLQILLTAFWRVPRSIRLVEPDGAHRWRLTPFGIAKLDTFADIVQLANLYSTFWPTRIDLRKTQKAIAVYAGGHHPKDENAIRRAHALLGIEQAADELQCQPGDADDGAIGANGAVPAA